MQLISTSSPNNLPRPLVNHLSLSHHPDTSDTEMTYGLAMRAIDNLLQAVTLASDSWQELTKDQAKWQQLRWEAIEQQVQHEKQLHDQLQEADKRLVATYHHSRALAEIDSNPSNTKPSFEHQIALGLHQIATQKYAPLGMFELAAMCLSNLGASHSESKAFEWYKKAADLGYAPAMEWVAVMYQDGRGVPVDSIKAFEWYMRAARLGQKISQHAIEILLNGDTCTYCGNLYLQGRKVDKDVSLAFDFFRLAAQKGHRRAMFCLGCLYSKGIGTGADQVQAFFWLEKAAKANDEQAQYQVALCYKNGIGTKADDRRFLQWLTRAANRGHRTARLCLSKLALSPLQQYQFAVHCFCGNNVEIDKPMAFKYYQDAAEARLPEAMCDLAWMYARGEGILTANTSQAIKWYTQSAQAGYLPAMYNLAVIHQNQDKSLKSQLLFFEWCSKAADAGFEPAKQHLTDYVIEPSFYTSYAQACFSGLYGIPQDHARAHTYFIKAAQNGDPEANTTFK